jgi:8-oxo-dGTP pyrophosphatase MutT (NUDIX family)
MSLENKCEPTLYTCPKKCCIIKIDHNINYEKYSPNRRGHNRKAGIFIYDSETDRVLLVQSKRNLWGMPKGTLDIDRYEHPYECAIRETKEETGLDVSPTEFIRVTKIKNRATYYFVIRKQEEVFIQKHEDVEKNDVCGIGWIKIDCLEDCLKSGQIILNQHCLVLFDRFLNKRFPSVLNSFTPVVRKH